jgi:hypothetical protein
MSATAAGAVSSAMKSCAALRCAATPEARDWAWRFCNVRVSPRGRRHGRQRHLRLRSLRPPLFRPTATGWSVSSPPWLSPVLGEGERP